jgi:hypothetical protein
MMPETAFDTTHKHFNPVDEPFSDSAFLLVTSCQYERGIATRIRSYPAEAVLGKRRV